MGKTAFDPKYILAGGTDGSNQTDLVTFQCKGTNWGSEGPGLTFIGLF